MCVWCVYKIDGPLLFSNRKINIYFCFYWLAKTFDWVVVVQSLSHVQSFATPWTVIRQASLSFTISGSLLKFRSIASLIKICNIQNIWPKTTKLGTIVDSKSKHTQIWRDLLWVGRYFSTQEGNLSSSPLLPFSPASILPLNILYIFPVYLGSFLSTP